MPFCTEASTFTNIYAAAEGKGGWYGHKWESVNEAELLWWQQLFRFVMEQEWVILAAFIAGG